MRYQDKTSTVHAAVGENLHAHQQDNIQCKMKLPGILQKLRTPVFSRLKFTRANTNEERKQGSSINKRKLQPSPTTSGHITQGTITRKNNQTNEEVDDYQLSITQCDPQCWNFQPMKNPQRSESHKFTPTHIKRNHSASFGNTVYQIAVKAITQLQFPNRVHQPLQTTAGLQLHHNYTWPLDHLNFVATNDVRNHYQYLIYETDIHGEDERYYNDKKSYLQQEAISRQSPERGQFINESSTRVGVT